MIQSLCNSYNFLLSHMLLPKRFVTNTIYYESIWQHGTQEYFVSCLSRHNFYTRNLHHTLPLSLVSDTLCSCGRTIFFLLYMSWTSLHLRPHGGRVWDELMGSSGQVRFGMCVIPADGPREESPQEPPGLPVFIRALRLHHCPLDNQTNNRTSPSTSI